MITESKQVEIIPERLYWVCDRSPPLLKNSHYFSIDSVSFT